VLIKFLYSLVKIHKGSLLKMNPGQVLMFIRGELLGEFLQSEGNLLRIFAELQKHLSVKDLFSV
jgi:hypothetical protein